MSSGDQATLYIATVDEPSVFSESADHMTIEWCSWYQHKKEIGRGKIMAYPLITPSFEVQQKAKQLRLRLRQELYGVDVVLPDQPPSMFAKGTTYIALRWVLDTCRREKMIPEEAMTLAHALTKM